LVPAAYLIFVKIAAGFLHEISSKHGASDYATVPAGILACCRLESPARRKRVIHTKTRRKIRESLPIRGVLSGRQDAALYVRRDARRYKRRHVHRAKHAKRKSH